MLRFQTHSTVSPAKSKSCLIFIVLPSSFRFIDDSASFFSDCFFSASISSNIDEKSLFFFSSDFFLSTGANKSLMSSSVSFLLLESVMLERLPRPPEEEVEDLDLGVVSLVKSGKESII